MKRYRLKDWRFVVLLHVVFVASFGLHCITRGPATPGWTWLLIGVVYVTVMLSKIEKK